MTIVVDIRPAPALGGTWTIPGWTLQGRWNPNEAERRASWDLLVELVTRVSVVPLGDDQGLLREALTSLHALFDATRATLIRHGPELPVARRGELSFAVISAHLLNAVLRPVLVEWHPRLVAHEAAGGSGRPTPRVGAGVGRLRRPPGPPAVTPSSRRPIRPRVRGGLRRRGIRPLPSRLRRPQST